MNSSPSYIRGQRPLRTLYESQLGITGLQTAIVLISFVIVSSVFAFAILSTGLFSAAKAKEATIRGIESTASTLVHKGSIRAFESAGTADTVARVTFRLTTVASATEVSLLPSTTLVVYIDAQNFKHALYEASGGVATPDEVGWSATWLFGEADTVEPGEIVEITVNVDGLANPLRKGTPFKIELIPGQGAAIVLERTTPLEITSLMDLE